MRSFFLGAKRIVRHRRLVGFWLLALLAVSCSRSFPSPSKTSTPQPGAIKGRLDLGGHVAADQVKGKQVSLLSQVDGSSQSQATDENGDFSFHGLADGTYIVSIRIPNFADTLLPTAVRHDHEVDLGVISPQFLPSAIGGGRLPLLRGQVVANLHPDGGGLVQRDGGDPQLDLGGTRITFIGEASGVRLVTFTDGQGNFAQSLDSDTYTIDAVNDLFVEGKVTFAVDADGGADGGVVLLPQALTLDINPAKLTGVAMLEVNSDQADAGTADGAFTPGAGVIVGTAFGGAGVSNGAGVFTVANLLGKPDQAFFTAPIDSFGQHYHDTVDEHAVALSPGQVTDMGAVKLYLDRGTISGTVRMADGTPAQDIAVSITGTHFAAQTSQDPLDASVAHFALPSVPARNGYQVRIHRDHYADVLVDAVDIHHDQELVDVGLKVLTRLSGDLSVTSLDADSAPGFTDARDVWVALSNSTGAQIAGVRISEDATFALSDGGSVPFSPYPPADGGYAFQLGDQDRAHTVYAQYEDTNQVPGALLTAFITLDRARPTGVTAALSSGARFTNQAQNPTLALAAQDLATLPAVASGVARMRLSLSGPDGGDLDGGVLASDPIPFAAYTTLATPPLADGPVSVFAQVLDNAGNESAIASSTFVVDTVPPAGNLVLSAPGAKQGYTNNPFIQVQELFADGDGGFDSAPHEPNGGYVTVYLANTAQANLDTAAPLPANSVQAWFLDAQGDGTKTVWMRLVDAAGNRSPDYSAQIVLDRVGPVVGVDLLAGGATNPAATNSASASLVFTTSESPAPDYAVFTAPQDCSQASGYQPYPSSQPATAPVTLAGADGPRTFYVCFKDASGNTTLSSVATQYKALPPSGAVSVVGALADGTPSSAITATAGVTLTLTASSDATGVAFGDESLSACPSSASAYGTLPSGPTPYTLTGSASPRVVKACLIDAAGNTAMLTTSIALDTDAPSGCSLTLTGVSRNGVASAPSGMTAAPGISVGVSACSEAPAEIALTTAAASCTNPALAWQPFTATLPLTLPSADGTYTVFACVRDAARNSAAASNSPTMQLLQIAPQPSQLLINGGAAYLNRAAWVAAGNQSVVTVSGSAPGATSWAVNEGSVPPVSSLGAIGSGSTSLTLSTGDGAKTVYAIFRDAVGNLSAPVSATITVKTSLPSGGAALLGTLADGTTSPTLTSTTGIKLSLTGVTPDATGYTAAESLASCPSGSGSYSALPTGSVTFNLAASQGARSVGVCFIDAAGNTNLGTSASISLDSVAPSGCTLTLTGVSLNGVAPSSTTTARTGITVGIAGCSETPAAVALVTAAAPTCTSSALNWLPFAASTAMTLPGTDGTYTVYACVRDAARNAGAGANQPTMQLIQAAPQPSNLTLNGGAAYYNRAQWVAAGNKTVVTVAGAATGATTWAVQEGSVPTSGFAAIGGGSQPLTLSAGEGLKTVYAVFRDQVGNLSPPVSASITVVLTPPSGGPASLPAYVSSLNVTVNLTSVGTATTAKVANTALANSCTGVLDVNGNVVGTTVAATALMPDTLLSGADGPRTVCVQLYDAAGNPSSVLTAATTAVQTRPAAPTLSLGTSNANTLVQDATDAITRNPTYTVTVTASGTSYFSSYIAQGGSGTPSIAGNSITFTLNAGTHAADAVNLLQVQTVDLAGNVGPSSTVRVVQEVSGDPQPATAFAALPRAGALELTWTASQSKAFVDHYLLEYGPTTSYGGIGALDGASPINVSNPCDASGNCKYHLEGLPDFQPAYLRLTPVSLLQSGVPATLGPVVPQEVSLIDLGGVNLGNVPQAMKVVDDRAYLVESYAPNGRLEIVDLSNPASPVALGSAVLDSPPGAYSAIEVLWPYAYVMADSALYTFDISNEASPTRLGKYIVTAYSPSELTAMAVTWPKVFLNVVPSGGVPNQATQLWELDVTNPASITKTASSSTPSYSSPYNGGIAVLGPYVYLGTSNTSSSGAQTTSLYTYPASTITSPNYSFTLQQNATSGGFIMQLLASAGAAPGSYPDLVFVEELGGKVAILQCTYYAYCTEVGGVAGLQNGSMALAGSDLIVAGGGSPSLLQILDVSDPTHPRLAGQTSTTAVAPPGGTAPATGVVAVAGGVVYVAGAVPGTPNQGRIEAFQLAHPSYAKLRGATALLGNNISGYGSSHITMAGSAAVVSSGGTGVSIIDVHDPDHPAGVMGAVGPTPNVLLGGGAYSAQTGGGAALAEQTVFWSQGNYSGSGNSGLVVGVFGYPDTSNCASPYAGPNCQMCAIARHPLSGDYYRAVASKGLYVYAVRNSGGMDVFAVPSTISPTCSATPPDIVPVKSGMALTTTPANDIQVHQHYAFVAEGYSFTGMVEIFDVANPANPVKKATASLPAPALGALSIAVREDTSCGSDCYKIFAGSDAAAGNTTQVTVYTWSPGAASLTQVSSISLPGNPWITALDAEFPSLFVGNLGNTASPAYGVNVYGTLAPFSFQSVVEPEAAGSFTYALGGAGRFSYADIGGNFVITELQ